MAITHGRLALRGELYGSFVALSDSGDIILSSVLGGTRRAANIMAVLGIARAIIFE